MRDSEDFKLSADELQSIYRLIRSDDLLSLINFSDFIGSYRNLYPSEHRVSHRALRKVYDCVLDRTLGRGKLVDRATMSDLRLGIPDLGITPLEYTDPTIKYSFDLLVYVGLMSRKVSTIRVHTLSMLTYITLANNRVIHWLEYLGISDAICDYLKSAKEMAKMDLEHVVSKARDAADSAAWYKDERRSNNPIVKANGSVDAKAALFFFKGCIESNTGRPVIINLSPKTTSMMSRFLSDRLYEGFDEDGIRDILSQIVAIWPSLRQSSLQATDLSKTGARYIVKPTVPSKPDFAFFYRFQSEILDIMEADADCRAESAARDARAAEEEEKRARHRENGGEAPDEPLYLCNFKSKRDFVNAMVARSFQASERKRSYT